MRSSSSSKQTAMAASEPGPVEMFAELVREHQAGLRAYVRSLGVDDIWVDDLAQEVFLVAYRRQADFKADADYGKWLRGIARHLVANERRKVARRSRLMHEGITDLLLTLSPAEDPDYDSSFARLGPAMQECVEQLPPHCREMLDRRYARSENAGSMARQLRMTAEAVRQNLRRIRLAVKACVERKLEGVWP
jgi:RNA polymerase sigma-70 factor, ECF subfamily